MVAACAGGANNDMAGADTLSQHQRDSVIGASRLPGARAVQRALNVSDSLAVRAQRLDSLPE